MKNYSAWEKFIGIFSRQRQQRHRVSERARAQHVARRRLQELLIKSDTIVGILKAQKGGAPASATKTSGRAFPR